MNNKGFTVVELLSTFTLTMIVTLLLFEIVVELKNVYVSSDIETKIKNENALIATAINKQIYTNNIPNNCETMLCNLQNGQTILVNSSSIKVGNKNFQMPKDVYIEEINLENKCDSNFTIYENCYLKISYKVTSNHLKNDIPVNLVLSYHS